MPGLDARTGRSLDGWAHVEQSIICILTTRFGEQIMREWVGSLVPELLGQNITAAVILPAIASVAVAIEAFEPRARLVDADIDAAPRDGKIGLRLILAYRPRALGGDLTEESERRVILI